MNHRLKQILVGLALVLTGSSYAQQTINVSTGWNNGVVPLNTLEDSWNVTIPGNTVVTPKSCQNGGLWDYSSSCSRWVSPVVASNGTALNSAAGTYTYQLNFTITPQTINCARFVINAIGADNSITGFSINNNNYLPSLGMPSGNNHFDPLKQNVEFYITPAHLTVGTNTITVTTYNNPYNGEGTEAAFNLCGEIYLNEDYNIHPVVTGPATICQGSPLTFGGSLALGSNPSTHYLWKILECDAAGNPVNGGFSWEMWYTGVPTGNFTFPSNLNITCGKYYMAVLAAVRESSCANWAQDFHIFSYVCKPIANAGADQTICQGECATVGTTIGNKGVSYSWTANGASVGYGLTTSVCPEVTTTYTVTATSNLTGCSNTDQVVVTVLPNEPRFNIATNTSNNNYYTVTGTPIVMNANLVSGFGQYWGVEELDANGNSLFHISNPNVWWSYPASCTFTGFDDYSLNYSGTYNTLPGSPSAGRFLYNHTYRITRGTWNDNCDWNAYAYILTTVKSANEGGYQVMVQETEAPDFKSSVKEAVENAWSISPNPSTGIFTVASESQGTKQTVFEVFDLFGKKVASKVIEAGTTRLSIDLSGNAKGVYILNITTDGVTKAHKIITE